MLKKPTCRGIAKRVALALALIVAAGLAPATGGSASLRAGIGEGPAGDSFYSPPAADISGKHGTVIWAREYSGAGAISGAKNYLVLYRSVSGKGETVAVSGTVAVPKGRKPKGGWPVVSWGHGTTGVADPCAPSRVTSSSSLYGGVKATNLYLSAWLKQGYAVVASDYQGLGTAGPHPYIIGVPEGRSVIDMVLAARRVDSSIGSKWVALGHSQGGHSVLFADRYGPTWGRGLRMVGTVALAPASHLSDAVKVVRLIKVPTRLSAFIPLILTGVETVADLDLSTILSPAAVGIYGQAETLCYPELAGSGSWGGLAPADAIRSDANLDAAMAVIDDNDPSGLRLRVPVFVAQGEDDTVVFPSLTTSMVKSLRKQGADVKYELYPGEDHSGVVSASYRDAVKWARARLKRGK